MESMISAIKDHIYPVIRDHIYPVITDHIYPVLKTPEVAGTIIEHVGYPLQVDNKIRELESATGDLIAIKGDVQKTIERDDRKNCPPTNEAIEWLRKVDTIEKEAEDIRENSRKRSRSIWSNYTTSRRAVKKAREVKILCDKKATIEITMHIPPPLLAQEMPASSSKSSNLESALQYIKDDEHNIIGIWGMGGVGKTHLLEQINNELSRDRTFLVIFVNCTKEFSKEYCEEKIQNIIIITQKLNNNGNMEQDSITIYSFLKQRSFVLLLDNLWSPVDLKRIGIPGPKDMVGTSKGKIVITTRSREVCAKMDVHRDIKVDVLKWDDAWSLFKEKVTEETINSDPLIQSYAVEVVKELGGLPLALITIGRAMRYKMDLNQWERAIDLLKQARFYDIECSSTNESVFHKLKFSYDMLKNETLKQCFLHCSLYPEDHHIKKSDLVELWMGLGLISRHSIHAAYNDGYSLIKDLQAVCLLVETDDDGYVKMHDVIRDMALWIANNQGSENIKWFVQALWIVQTGTFKESTKIEVSRNTEKLSLMYDTTEKVLLSAGCSSTKFTFSSTKLSTLLLRDNSLCDSKSLQLEAFSKLAVLDLSWNNFEAFPIEICKLVQLQFLNLSWNFQLKSLPKELEALINLKYLLLCDAINCTIPNGVLSKLKALRVLQLLHNYHVRGTEDELRIFTSLEEELRSLFYFQALGITISNLDDLKKLAKSSFMPVRWLSIENFEVKGSITSSNGEDFDEECSTTSSNSENFYVDGSVKPSTFSFTSYFLWNTQLQNNLVSLELNGIVVECVKFERENHEDNTCNLGRLEHLLIRQMKTMKEIVWMGLAPKDVFFRLRVLQFENCGQLTSISWVACLPAVRILHVKWCKSIKKMITTDELNNCGLTICQPSFRFLKEMSLFGNVQLERISDSLVTFPALESLLVSVCCRLKKLPFQTDSPPKMLRLSGTEDWWKNIEMDDITHRSLLQPFFYSIL